jgi:hypothetical protein
VKNVFVEYVPNTSALRWFCSVFAAGALAGACGNETVDDLFTSNVQRSAAGRRRANHRPGSGRNGWGGDRAAEPAWHGRGASNRRRR